MIFDGLDEVRNRIGGEYAAQLYRQFLGTLPSGLLAGERQAGKPDWDQCPTRLIITCRTHFFRSLGEQTAVLNGFHRGSVRSASTGGEEGGRGAKAGAMVVYHMAPLSLERIEELFKNELGEELGATTVALVEKVHDLAGLAKRPIMARFIGEMAGDLIERSKSGAVINIATVYEELFQQCLSRDNEKVPLLTITDRQDMLTALAGHMLVNGKSSLTASELERWLDRFALSHEGLRVALVSSGATTRSIRQTELRTASLLIRGSDDGFSFAHTSFYEYFLAHAISAGLDDPDHLAPLSGRPISNETFDFIWAIADRDDTGQPLEDKLVRVLTGEAEKSVRWLAYTLLTKRSGDFKMPANANLSGFDLRESRIGHNKPAVWQNVDLTGTSLNASDVRHTTFRHCCFDRTSLGNATVERCVFDGCTGLPRGLSSVRSCDTTLADTWHAKTHSLQKVSNEPEPGTAARAKLSMGSVLSVAVTRDGTALVTGGSDGTARVRDLASGAEIRRILPLPDTWAVLDRSNTILSGGPGLWRYTA